MAKIVKKGYGQVEPNHLSGQRTGQIYAQLPAASSFDVVENGMFLKYDMVAGEMNTTGAGEDMLVYSEIKLYDKNRQGYKDFALLKTESHEGKIYPRLIKTNVGDIFTTNLADVTSAAGSIKGKLFQIVDGILTEDATPTAGAQTWVCVKETTMPDGQTALKFNRVV